MKKEMIALIEDKAFQEELKVCDSPKAMIECFSAHGVEMSEKQAEEMFRAMAKKVDGQIEFTKDELEKITGGLLIPYPERKK